jgi:hypothetical protein
MPLLNNIKKNFVSHLVKCYHHLRPLFENAIIDYDVVKYCSLDIFEMTKNTNELMKELVTRGLFDFQVDAKDTKCLFNGGRSMNLCFLQLDFLPIKS